MVAAQASIRTALRNTVLLMAKKEVRMDQGPGKAEPPSSWPGQAFQEALLGINWSKSLSWDTCSWQPGLQRPLCEVCVSCVCHISWAKRSGSRAVSTAVSTACQQQQGLHLTTTGMEFIWLLVQRNVSSTLLVLRLTWSSSMLPKL